jgi:hypothetical protein
VGGLFIAEIAVFREIMLLLDLVHLRFLSCYAHKLPIVKTEKQEDNPDSFCLLPFALLKRI